MSNDDAWHKAMGNTRSQSVTWYQRAKDIVKTHGVRGAAEQLGVTARTVKSWVHRDRTKRTTPSKANQSRVQDAHQTPEVRRAIAPRRTARLSQNGMRVTMAGNIRPASSGSEYERFRQISFSLPSDAAAHVMDAFTEGGPEAAKQALQDEMQAGAYRLNGNPDAMEFNDLEELRFSDRSAFDTDMDEF